MALPKDSCWHDWPFDADLVLRKTGARRLGDPTIALALLAALAREQGHDVKLYRRDSRLEAQTVVAGREPNREYVKEQAQYALGIGDQLFMMSSARSWDEELIVAHRRVATGTFRPNQRQQTSWIDHAREDVFPSASRQLLNQARPLAVPRARWNAGAIIGRSRLERLIATGRTVPENAAVHTLAPDRSSAEEYWAAIAYHLRGKGVDAVVHQSTDARAIPFKWPANQGNDLVQLVRKRYTLSLGRLLLHSDQHDNGDSLMVQSARNRVCLDTPLSKNLDPENHGFPGDVDAILRLIHLQHLDANLPPADAEPSARPKVRL